MPDILQVMSMWYSLDPNDHGSGENVEVRVDR